jgi:hypothetical protein
MFGAHKIGRKAALKSKAQFKKIHTNLIAGILGIPKQRQLYCTEHDLMNTPVSVWHGNWWIKDLRIFMFLKAGGMSGKKLNIPPNRNKSTILNRFNDAVAIDAQWKSA